MAEYISTKKAAERLGVSMTRIRFLITAGRIKADKIGNSWAIDPQAFQAFIDNRAGRLDYELGPDQDDQVFNKPPAAGPDPAAKKGGGRPI